MTIHASAPLTLINPQNGHLALRLFSFEDNSFFDHLQRLNYYTVILLTKGKVTAKADFKDYTVDTPGLFCFSPYQPFMFSSTEKIEGLVINFHPDFFCIHRHQKEIACNGVLFNNIYDPPFLKIDNNDLKQLAGIYQQMRTEMQLSALAQYELLVSYLKIFLINASRLKMNQFPGNDIATETKEPFILQTLKDAIESNYKTIHAPADYASLLHISPKALGKITKTHFNKTLTELISERIIIEAKRELYLTSKAVKSIAYELGFDDEYYFSRFFKKNVDVSPQLYRDTVGFAKAEA